MNAHQVGNPVAIGCGISFILVTGELRCSPHLSFPQISPEPPKATVHSLSPSEAQFIPSFPGLSVFTLLNY